MLPQARCRWALDSGGFTELALHGRWTLPAASDAEQVAGYASLLGLAAEIDKNALAPW